MTGTGNWGTWGFGGEKLVVPDRKLVKVLPSNRHGIRGHTRQRRLIYKQPDQTQPGDSQNYHMATWRAGRLGFVLAGECGLGSDDQSRAQGYRRGRHNSHTVSGRIMLFAGGEPWMMPLDGTKDSDCSSRVGRYFRPSVKSLACIRWTGAISSHSGSAIQSSPCHYSLLVRWTRERIQGPSPAFLLRQAHLIS